MVIFKLCFKNLLILNMYILSRGFEDRCKRQCIFYSFSPIDSLCPCFASLYVLKCLKCSRSHRLTSLVAAQCVKFTCEQQWTAPSIRLRWIVYICCTQAGLYKGGIFLCGFCCESQASTRSSVTFTVRGSCINAPI